MSDAQAVPVDARKKQLQDLEMVRDLFARAHDYIAQSKFPGSMGVQVAEVLNFLKFQHGDFKQRVETMRKQIESEVNVAAAKAAADKVLSEQGAVAPATPEAPKV